MNRKWFILSSVGLACIGGIVFSRYTNAPERRAAQAVVAFFEAVQDRDYERAVKYLEHRSFRNDDETRAMMKKTEKAAERITDVKIVSTEEVEDGLVKVLATFTSSFLGHQEVQYIVQNTGDHWEVVIDPKIGSGDLGTLNVDP